MLDNELVGILRSHNRQMVWVNMAMERIFGYEMGGDEFVLLLTDLESEDQYKLVLQRVIETINEPIFIDVSNKVTVGASIGITLFPADSANPDTLLRHADQAMYQAKRSGRNRVYQYEAHAK